MKKKLLVYFWMLTLFYLTNRFVFMALMEYCVVNVCLGDYEFVKSTRNGLDYSYSNNQEENSDRVRLADDISTLLIAHQSIQIMVVSWLWTKSKLIISHLKYIQVEILLMSVYIAFLLSLPYKEIAHSTFDIQVSFQLLVQPQEHI